MPARSSRFWLPLGLALAGSAALSVDLPIAHTLREWNHSETVHAYLDYFDVFEPFGQCLMGVLVVAALMHQLDASRRWAIPRLAACTAAGGLMADLLKMLLARTRPYDFAFDGSVWSTFGPWLPGWSAGSGGQSFPSGHTATAAALAAALMWLYPNGRRLFVALVILVGCQRIVSGAHFPSDVLFGAAAGCLMAQGFLQVGHLSQWFTRREAAWRTSRAPSLKNPG